MCWRHWEMVPPLQRAMIRAQWNSGLPLALYEPAWQTAVDTVERALARAAGS